MKSMNEQMELFELGGLKSNDNLKNDPVSGNPIPPGSNAKEVRDDLPAMLSEGEYVVPADVVKYFGVDRFEKMRDEAKAGLAKMDKDGRIGGEPVDPVLPQGMPKPPQMMNVGGLSRDDVTGRNFYTGEFSFERPGAGRYDYTPGEPLPPIPGTPEPTTDEAPSPESCAKKGLVYDPVLKVCVSPQVQVQQGGGGGDDSPTPTPQPAWYTTANWANPQDEMANMFPDQQLPGLMGNVLGAVGGVGNLATARAMVNVYNMMGQTEQAKIINDQIEEELAESKGLGYADDLLDNIFGSDGDIKTIAAMREAGIDVPRNLRDADFREYMRNISPRDREKLVSFYGEGGKYNKAEKVIKPKVETPAPIEDIKPQDYTDQQMADERAKFEERQRANLEAEQRARQSQQRRDEDRRANDSFHQQMVRNAVERMQSQRDPMGQRTTTATYNTPSTGRFSVSADDDGLNKGGLMVRKKKKKK